MACFLFAFYRIAKDTVPIAALAWLAPAPAYFAVYRFDIYPALATLMALLAIRRTAYYEGALWLGIAIALKGYALFLLPAYCVYVIDRRDFGTAVKVGLLCVAPIALALLGTVAFAGLEGATAAFKVHAIRTLNGESSYDAINYLFGYRTFSGNSPLIPRGDEIRPLSQVLQVTCALAAAALRPRSFEALVDAFLLALAGFMSFSVFYSPQWVLWILPLTCFSRSRIVQIAAIAFSWFSYLYFPIVYKLQPPHLAMFSAVVVGATLLRLSIMIASAKGIVSDYWGTPPGWFFKS